MYGTKPYCLTIIVWPLLFDHVWLMSNDHVCLMSNDTGVQAMRLTKPGGLLMTCSCSGAVSEDAHFLPMLKVSTAFCMQASYALHQDFQPQHTTHPYCRDVSHVPQSMFPFVGCLVKQSTLVSTSTPKGKEEHFVVYCKWNRVCGQQCCLANSQQQVTPWFATALTKAACKMIHDSASGCVLSHNKFSTIWACGNDRCLADVPLRRCCSLYRYQPTLHHAYKLKIHSETPVYTACLPIERHVHSKQLVEELSSLCRKLPNQQGVILVFWEVQEQHQIIPLIQAILRGLISKTSCCLFNDSWYWPWLEDSSHRWQFWDNWCCQMAHMHCHEA